MKNFGTLYQYELKKLVKQKLSWGILVLLSLFCIYTIVKNSGASMTMESIDEKGNIVETVVSRKQISLYYRDSVRKSMGR